MSSLGTYFSLRVLLCVALGFMSGLPLLLTLSTLYAWLASEGVDKGTIGLFALVGLPYNLKFLWAPLFDQIKLPFLYAKLGRRRSWIIFCQALLIATLLSMAGLSPKETPWLLALAAFILAFASASQDIGLDAYRVELLSPETQALGAGANVLGYRLGMLASGAGALGIAHFQGWFWAYASMAGLLGILALLLLFAPEPQEEACEEKGWKEKVLAPLRDFLGRPGWGVILALVIAYKLADAFMGSMANPFYVEIGFSLGEIAAVSKVFGMGATIIGGILGGILAARLGLWPSLLGCAILQAASNLVFIAQARIGPDVGFLTLTIGIENLSGGMGSAVFVAYLSLLCKKSYTASQYALLSALAALGRVLLGTPAGFVAESLGWEWFFCISALLGLPGIGLLLWLRLKLSRPT